MYVFASYMRAEIRKTLRFSHCPLLGLALPWLVLSRIVPYATQQSPSNIRLVVGAGRSAASSNGELYRELQTQGLRALAVADARGGGWRFRSIAECRRVR